MNIPAYRAPCQTQGAHVLFVSLYSVDELLASPALESNRDFSVEFCGGTHMGNTSEARAFALISEEGER